MQMGGKRGRQKSSLPQSAFPDSRGVATLGHREERLCDSRWHSRQPRFESSKSTHLRDDCAGVSKSTSSSDAASLKLVAHLNWRFRRLQRPACHGRVLSVCKNGSRTGQSLNNRTYPLFLVRGKDLSDCFPHFITSEILFCASPVGGRFDVVQQPFDDVGGGKTFALRFEVGDDAVAEHRGSDSDVPSVQAHYQNSSWKEGCAKSERQTDVSSEDKLPRNRLIAWGSDPSSLLFLAVVFTRSQKSPRRFLTSVKIYRSLGCAYRTALSRCATAPRPGPQNGLDGRPSSSWQDDPRPEPTGRPSRLSQLGRGVSPRTHS